MAKDRETALERTHRLIARAVHDGTPRVEALESALQAVRLIAKHDLLGDDDAELGPEEGDGSGGLGSLADLINSPEARVVRQAAADLARNLGPLFAQARAATAPRARPRGRRAPSRGRRG